MKNQCSYQIILRKELFSKKKNTAPLALQAFINGKRIVISLNLYIPLDNWDSENKKVIGKEFHDFNLILEKSRAKANEIIIDARLQGKFLTPDQFKEQFTSNNSKHDFLAFYETELEQRFTRDLISAGTYRGQKVTLNKLKRFQPNILFGELTSDFIERFDAWHKKDVKITLVKKNMEPVKESLGIRAKALKHIRTYIKLAEKKKNLFIQDPFQTVKIREAKETNRVFLEQNEIKALVEVFESGQLNDYLQSTLAKFLFACFTSIRVSDAKNLEEMALINNTLTFIPVKTKRLGKVVKIPLNQTAFKFFHYLKNHGVKNVSAEKLNLGLKKIAIVSGINKRITFHTARHTFGAQFIASGGELVVLQSIMGHSDIRTTMVYVHLAKNLKEDQLFRMDTLLN